MLASFDAKIARIAEIENFPFVYGLYLYSSNKRRILSQFKPSEKVQSQGLPGATPPRSLPGLFPRPVGELIVPQTPSGLGNDFVIACVPAAQTSRLARRKKNDSEYSPCLPLHSKCPISPMLADINHFFFNVLAVKGQSVN